MSHIEAVCHLRSFEILLSDGMAARGFAAGLPDIPGRARPSWDRIPQPPAKGNAFSVLFSSGRAETAAKLEIVTN